MPSDTPHNVLALDVGERRIGLAFGDTAVKLPITLPAVKASVFDVDYLKAAINDKDVSVLVVGLPRNQSGEETAQTRYVRSFITALGDIGVPVVYQDESLTSVLAEERLQAAGRPYSKGDIDSMAAALILQDYLEGRHS